ncbi:MAG: non-canonical purine NTP pyrophosphatase [Marinilabiliales bacterium]|nr:MAG: non-canonical purine NTP pyrophosphatase [Marinilabiliales bacterium]
MIEKFVFATNNQHKLEEVREIAEERFEIMGLKDINCFEDIPENQNTLEGNSLQKARYVFEKYNINCFADDTGLEVDALNGAPGVYSARYAGQDKNSEDNIDKLLNELKDLPFRKARFRTVVALVLDGKEYFFEGIVEGEIIEQRKGEGGFGYDAVFMPEGLNATFAELPPLVKNSISHRAIAIQKMLYFLRHYQHSSN